MSLFDFFLKDVPSKSLSEISLSEIKNSRKSYKKIAEEVLKLIPNLTTTKVKKLNELDNDYETILHYACKFIPKIVEPLLKAGVNPNIRDIEKETSLHIACKYKPKLVSILLKYNAELNLKNSYGETPLDILIKNKNYDNLILLQVYGGTPNKQKIPFEYTLESFKNQYQVLREQMNDISAQLILNQLYDIPIGHKYYKTL